MGRISSSRSLLIISWLGLGFGILIATLNVHFSATLAAIALAVLSVFGLAKYEWEGGTKLFRDL